MTDWIRPQTATKPLRPSWPHIDLTQFWAHAQNWVLGSLPILGLLLVWHLIATSGSVPSYLLPTPQVVLDTLLRELGNGRIVEHLSLSLQHYTMGLAWGIGLGCALGLVTGWFSLGKRLIEPLIALLRPIPPLAWIPFAIIVIGINTRAAAFIIGIGAFYINFYNTLSGVRSVDQKLLEAARVLGDRFPGILWRVVLPAAAPSMLTGIRISLGQGWMTVIAAEMFGIRGLGQRLMEAAGLLAMEVVMTYMIVIGAMHLAMDVLFRLAERTILRWR